MDVRTVKKNGKSEIKEREIFGLSLLLVFAFIFSGGVSLAEEGDLGDLLDSERDLLQRDLLHAEAVFNKGEVPEELPVEESKNDGYWWIKQDESTKLSYVNILRTIFRGEAIRSEPEELVKKLDVFYNPIDDPIDIKMDKSLERAFSLIIKEDAK